MGVGSVNNGVLFRAPQLGKHKPDRKESPAFSLQEVENTRDSASASREKHLCLSWSRLVQIYADTIDKRRLLIIKDGSLAPTQAVLRRPVLLDGQGTMFNMRKLDYKPNPVFVVRDVASVYKSELVKRQPIKFLDATCHSMGLINASFLHSTGADEFAAKIAIIDSAYTYTDPSSERTFDTFKKRPKTTVIHSCDKFMTRLSNHGLFCASVVAAKYRDATFDGAVGKRIGGVLPQAQLHTYALGCRSCEITRAHVRKAFARAIVDGVDIIALFQEVVGPKFDKIEDDFIGQAALKAFGKGIITCLPVGNRGPSPGTARYGIPWCVNVGACTSGKMLVTDVEVAIEEEDVLPSTKILRREGAFVVIGKFRGVSYNLVNHTSFVLLSYAPRSKGRESILHMVSPDSVELHEARPAHRDHILLLKPHKDPFTAISEVNSDRLWDWVDEFRTIFVKISTSKYCDDQRGIHVPEFSARGPSALYRDVITPDLLAPAYAILAFCPIDEIVGGLPYKDQMAYSGTSIACAFVTACLAAVKKKHPDWSAFAVKSAAVTTAKSLAEDGVPGNEFSYGAGVIQVEKAFKPGLIYDEIESNFEAYTLGRYDVYKLNLPSFASSYAHCPKRCLRVFHRELTNVSDDAVEYEARVRYFSRSLDPDVSIKVEPTKLRFEPGDTKAFKVKVRLIPRPLGYVSAQLRWEAEKGQGVVSPIHLYHDSPYDKAVYS